MKQSLTDWNKKVNDSVREYKALERNQCQVKHEKENLASYSLEFEPRIIEEQDISRLKSWINNIQIKESQSNLEESHKKQIASYKMLYTFCDNIELWCMQKSVDISMKSEMTLKSKNVRSKWTGVCIWRECKNNAEKRVSQLL